MNYKYYFFGSEDSLDKDVLVDHPEATGTDADILLAEELKNQDQTCANWDINIIKIENGYVTKSIPTKGNIDSVNNALFQTYKLHNQPFELPIIGNLPRNLLLAIARCIREIMVSVKQIPLYKAQIRPALKGTFADRIEALPKISYKQMSELSEEAQMRIFKRVSFRLGQTLSLLNGIEIYTKRDFKKYHPDLANIIDRVSLPKSGQLEEKINEIYNILKILDIQQIGPTSIRWQQYSTDYNIEMDLIEPGIYVKKVQTL